MQEHGGVDVTVRDSGAIVLGGATAAVSGNYSVIAGGAITDLIAEIERYLTPAERAELNALLAKDFEERPWTPLSGPQTLAYESIADVVGFGGAAGGDGLHLLHW